MKRMRTTITAVLVSLKTKAYQVLVWLMHKLVMPMNHAGYGTLQLILSLLIVWLLTSLFYWIANARESVSHLTNIPEINLDELHQTSHYTVSRSSSGLDFILRNKNNEKVFFLRLEYLQGHHIRAQIVPAVDNAGSSFTSHDPRTDGDIYFLRIVQDSWPPAWFFRTTYTLEFSADPTILSILLDEQIKGIANIELEAPTPEDVIGAKLLLRNLVRNYLDLDGLGARVLYARTINGPIQYCTIFLFVYLLVVMASRYVVYVKDERLIGRTSRFINLPSTATREEREEALKQDNAELQERTGIQFRKNDIFHTAAGYLGFDFRDGTFFPKVSSYLLILGKTHEYASKRGIARKEIPDLIKHDVEVIQERSFAGYGIPRYLIWAIPTVGFVGTIVGISLAMGATGGVGSPEVFEQAISRSLVTSAIGIAFDTTLVALLLSLVGMWILTIVQSAESVLLADVRREAIQAVLRTSDRDDTGERSGR